MTQALTRRHRVELAAILRVVDRRVARAVRAATPADIDRWWVRYGPALTSTVTAANRAASASALRYLIAEARAAEVGVLPVVVPPNRDQIVTSLHVTGPVSFKRHLTLSGSQGAALRNLRTTLGGASERLALTGSRDTIVATADRAGARTRRVTSGGACDFCLMLAGRGAVYTPETGGFQSHDHCRCTPELVLT